MHCFSTATTVARMRLNIRLYIHCLSFFKLLRPNVGKWVENSAPPAVSQISTDSVYHFFLIPNKLTVHSIQNY